jgi:hypothetical protein
MYKGTTYGWSKLPRGQIWWTLITDIVGSDTTFARVDNRDTVNVSIYKLKTDSIVNKGYFSVYKGTLKEDKSNKVTSISGSSTDTEYPSAKLTYDQLALKAPVDNPTFTTKITTPAINIPTSATVGYFWKCTNATTGAGEWTSVTSSAQYKGAYDASGGGHGSPALTDGTGTLGDYYTCTVAGTVDTHSGNVTLAVGDQMMYNGATWDKIPVSISVNLTGPITSVGNATSIASQTGTGSTFAMSASPAFTGLPTVKSAGVSNDLYAGINSANTNYLFKFRENVSGNSQFFMYDVSNALNVLINASGGSYFNGGNVGIGTASPTSKLQVHSDGGIKAMESTDDVTRKNSLYLGADATGSFIKTDYSSGGSFDLRFVNYTTEIARFKSGNFGIGTNNPGTKLDVNGVITATDGTSTQWNAAYTHSQIAGGNSVHVSVAENGFWDAAYTHACIAGGTDVHISAAERTAWNSKAEVVAPGNANNLMVSNGTIWQSIAVPTWNQNTTGSAATLTTTRAIYGNNFNGSAALTQIIASTYGGTGNGFTKFSGPTTAEKTFTLPNANATLARTDAGQTFTGNQVVNGNITFTDNTYDIGASGATRPRTGYFGTSLISPLFNGLAITNNGTNTLTITAGKTFTSLHTLTLDGTDGTTMTFPHASANVLTDHDPVTTPQGGTGLTTLTDESVIIGQGSGSPSFVAPGTTGNVLLSNGTSWTSAGMGANHTLDGHSNVTITTNSSGELLKWNGSAWVNNTLVEAGIQPLHASLTSISGLIEAAGTLIYGTADNAYAALAAGATTTVLVGGGAAAPVWTTATGSGAPVRATSPTLVTPILGTPTSGTLTNCTNANWDAAYTHISDAVKHVTAGDKAYWDSKEDALGNPAVTGYVLTSTSIGARSWTPVQATLNGTGFVKVSGTTVSYDNSTYLTSLGTALVDADFAANGAMVRTGSGTYSTITPGTSGYVLTSNGTAWVSSASVTGNATHTGDVTGSTALTIANASVTLAKMANMATASLIYRKTAGAGAPEVNSLATLKTDLGLTGTNSGDQSLSGLVPYTGATTDLNMGAHIVTATNFQLSDRRLKTNIRSINDLPHFDKIDFIQFNMKSDLKTVHYGVIAQDLELIAPELVRTDRAGIKSVNYIELLVIKIAELENRVSELEKANDRQVKRDWYFYKKGKRHEK